MSGNRSYLPSYSLHDGPDASTTRAYRPDLPVNNQDFTNAAVVIIGGGISGMCTAIDLLVNRHVKNFVIFEKSGGFGGTWCVSSCPVACWPADSILGATTSSRAAVATSSASYTPTPLHRTLDGPVDIPDRKRF